MDMAEKKLPKKKLSEEEKIQKMAQEKNEKIARKEAELRKKYEDELNKFKEELELDPYELEIKKIDEYIAAKMAKKKQLKKNMESKVKGNNQTEETRKKIIMGAYIMGKPEIWNQHIKSSDFDKFVERPIERELFGLTALKATQTTPTIPSENN